MAAASDTAVDYSHAVALTVSGKNAVVQMRLPQAVYLHARSADLRDLRVFDASGTALPFALIQPDSQSGASRRDLPVKVFQTVSDQPLTRWRSRCQRACATTTRRWSWT